MTRALCAAIVAAVALYALASPAAAKNSPAHSSLTAIQLECFKQQGAFYDAETKRWKMTGTDNTMLSRMEAVNTCVMQKTGKRPEPFLREERTYH